MSVHQGTLGGTPYVSIDDIEFPLTPGAYLQRIPLNPFSPVSQAGNTSRVTDARLAAEVWDDFTGGMGQRDEDQKSSTSYSIGNLDTRVPGAIALPPIATLLAGVTGFTAAHAPVYVEHMRDETNYAILAWSPKRAGYYRKLSGATGVFNTTSIAGTLSGLTSFNGAYYAVSWDGTNSRIYSTADLGATWTVRHTSAAAAQYARLVTYDNRLWTINRTNHILLVSADGATFANEGTALIVNPGEVITDLLVWNTPSGSDQLIYALTNQRLLVYNEPGVIWNEFYSFEGVIQARYTRGHVFRRDSNLYVTFMDDTASALRDKQGLVLMFTPGTSDEVGPAKRYGIPTTLIDGLTHAQGGVHWLFAWGAGTPGVFMAMNEFAGWSTLFDPATVGTANLIGGGYANGRAWCALDNGNMYELSVPDRRELPPRVDGGTYNAGSHYVRSAWTEHNQKNRLKLGAYFEIDCRLSDGTSGVPTGSGVTLRYRVDNQPWVTIVLSDINQESTDTVGTLLTRSVPPSAQTWPAIVLLPNNVEEKGLPYRRLQWEIQLQRSAPATGTPVLASVTLYYTFWQESHFSYQFNIDLTWQSWAEFPDQVFAGRTRDELRAKLLDLVRQKNYHRFNYADGPNAVVLDACDMLLAGREDTELGGGVYSVTVRDLGV